MATKKKKERTPAQKAADAKRRQAAKKKREAKDAESKDTVVQDAAPETSTSVEEPIKAADGRVVTVDDPEPEEIIQVDDKDELIVRVVAHNCVWNSQIRKPGDLLRLRNKEEFVGSQMRWVNKDGELEPINFNRKAIPGSFRAAMQKIALGDTDQSTVSDK